MVGAKTSDPHRDTLVAAMAEIAAAAAYSAQSKHYTAAATLQHAAGLLARLAAMPRQNTKPSKALIAAAAPWGEPGTRGMPMATSGKSQPHGGSVRKGLQWLSFHSQRDPRQQWVLQASHVAAVCQHNIAVEMMAQRRSVEALKAAQCAELLARCDPSEGRYSRAPNPCVKALRKD